MLDRLVVKFETFCELVCILGTSLEGPEYTRSRLAASSTCKQVPHDILHRYREMRKYKKVVLEFIRFDTGRAGNGLHENVSDEDDDKPEKYRPHAERNQGE